LDDPLHSSKKIRDRTAWFHLSIVGTNIVDDFYHIVARFDRALHADRACISNPGSPGGGCRLTPASRKTKIWNQRALQCSERAFQYFKADRLGSPYRGSEEAADFPHSFQRFCERLVRTNGHVWSHITERGIEFGCR